MMDLQELKKLDSAAVTAMVNDLRRMSEMMGREHDKAAIEMCRRPDLLRQFADAIEQLQRELEEARKPKTFADRIAAQQTVLARTIENAERYEWLRCNGGSGIKAPYTYLDIGCTAEQLDAAIDAARQQKI